MDSRSYDKYCPITHELNCKCAVNRIKISSLQVDLKSSLRKLFTDHGMYLKFAIDSILNKSNDLNVLIQRLHKNQQEIAYQIRSVLGESNTLTLISYLIRHVDLIIDLCKFIHNKFSNNISNTIFSNNIFSNNMFSNNTNNMFGSFNDITLDFNIKILNNHGDEMSKFITSLHQNKLPFDKIKYFWNRYDNFILDIIKSRILEKHETEYKLYDSYYNELLEFSDLLSNSLYP